MNDYGMAACGAKRPSAIGICELIYSSGIPASRNASAKSEKISGTIPTVTDQLRIVKVGSSSLTRCASAIASDLRSSRINAS